MKLARDTDYKCPTLGAARRLVEHFVGHPVEMQPMQDDEKSYLLNLKGLQYLKGNVIWTNDFMEWHVHSRTILNLRRQTRGLI